MCTSIRLSGVRTFFGRNMDIECSFGENVALTPRGYTIKLRHEREVNSHYAILGMASVIDSYPLYADAFNEKGLCIAGLNFPVNTRYLPIEEIDPEKYRIAPFEFPLFLLSKCKSVEECKALLNDTGITDVSFSDQLKATPLHWHIADKDSSVVVECLSTGISVLDDPADVLANNPPFDMQIMNLAAYQNLTPQKAENCLSRLGNFYSLGKAFGAVGLPGDFSSPSRFVKSAYLTALSRMLPPSEITLAHLFSLLRSVAVPKGAVTDSGETGKSHYTLYTCGMDIENMSYNYQRYDCLDLNTVYMRQEDIDGRDILIFGDANDKGLA